MEKIQQNIDKIEFVPKTEDKETESEEEQKENIKNDNDYEE